LRKGSRSCSLTGGSCMQRLDDRSRMSGDVHVRFRGDYVHNTHHSMSLKIKGLLS
jgi:hypothetical protein